MVYFLYMPALPRAMLIIVRFRSFPFARSWSCFLKGIHEVFDELATSWLKQICHHHNLVFSCDTLHLCAVKNKPARGGGRELILWKLSLDVHMHTVAHACPLTHTPNNDKLNEIKYGAGQMASRGLQIDSNSSSSGWQLTTTYNSSSRRSDTFLWLLQPFALMPYMQSYHTHSTHTHMHTWSQVMTAKDRSRLCKVSHLPRGPTNCCFHRCRFPW